MTTKILFLLNDAPYGSDKNYNALRTAIQLQKQDQNIKIWVYLMSDSVAGALSGQKEKTGQYNIGEMLTNIIKNGGEVKLCTSCAESRGVSSFVPGAVLGTSRQYFNRRICCERHEDKKKLPNSLFLKSVFLIPMEILKSLSLKDTMQNSMMPGFVITPCFLNLNMKVRRLEL